MFLDFSLTFKKANKIIKDIILICFYLLWLVSPVSADNHTVEPSIYISFPGDISPSKLEEMILSKCTDFNIKVYKTYSEFSRQVTNNSPDAIINYNGHKKLKGYKQLFQGIRNNSHREPYVLITNGKNITDNDINGLRIGVVDFIGSKHLSEYITNILQANMDVIGLFKNSDINTALLFNRVDAIFTSKKSYLHQKSKTAMNLISNDINISLDLLSIQAKDNTNKKRIRSCINKFDSKINSHMGVDQWK